jgi:CHAP domain
MSRLAIVQRVRGIEEGELGTRERPGNDVKYNTAYYGHHVHDGHPPHVTYAWCVVFQWWCFQKASIPTSVFPKASNVFAVRDWFKRKGRFYHTPMPGDLVIFAWSHIGFVEKLLAANHIQTIEGNRDDAVRRHTYKANDPRIQGYCRPEYHKVTVPPPPTDKKTEAIVRALPRLQNGDQGANVKRLQALLRANGQKLTHSQNQDGSFDGDFGNDTETALKAVTGSKVADDAQWAKLLGV